MTVDIFEKRHVVCAGLQTLLADSSFQVRRTYRKASDWADAPADNADVLIVGKAALEDVPLPRRDKILMLADKTFEKEVAILLRLGVGGIVTFEEEPGILVAALRCVARGGKWIPSLVRTVPDDLPPMRLTPREVEIKELLLRGYTNRAIGETLAIASGTVKIHVRNILHKTGANSRAGLIVSQFRPAGPTPPCELSDL